MGNFFEDTMTGLLQAISIEKGNIEMEKIPNMPADTYRVAKDELNRYNIIYSSNSKEQNLQNV